MGSDNMIEVIYLEGNIGCGKSTTLEYLESKGEVTVPERVQEWIFLDQFYKDYKCAFQLQTEIALSRRENLHKGLALARELGKSRIFVERSVKTGALFSEGLDALECSVLDKLYDALSHQQVQMYTEKTVYFKVAPEVCCQRIEKRGRDSERTIDREYIYKLHDIFEAHFKTTAKTIAIDITEHMDVQGISESILGLL